jgi:mitogen-activated protein kinase kinase kinase
MGGATTMKGSVFWMAPEVVFSSHERGYSGKVDIWSLGCVVLEMWTGKRPWGEVEQVAALFEVGNVHTCAHLSQLMLDP